MKKLAGAFVYAKLCSTSTSGGWEGVAGKGEAGQGWLAGGAWAGVAGQGWLGKGGWDGVAGQRWLARGAWAGVVGQGYQEEEHQHQHVPAMLPCHLPIMCVIALAQTFAYIPPLNKYRGMKESSN